MHLMREAIKGTGASSEPAVAHEDLLFWLETISRLRSGLRQRCDERSLQRCAGGRGAERSAVLAGAASRSRCHAHGDARTIRVP